MNFKVGDKVKLIDKYGSRYYNGNSSAGRIENIDYGILLEHWGGDNFSVTWYLKNNTVRSGFNVFESEMELYPEINVIENIINNLEKIEEKYE